MAEVSVPIRGIAGGILAAVIIITMVVVFGLREKYHNRFVVSSHIHICFFPINNTKCLSIDIGTINTTSMYKKEGYNIMWYMA